MYRCIYKICVYKYILSIYKYIYVYTHLFTYVYIHTYFIESKPALERPHEDHQGQLPTQHKSKPSSKRDAQTLLRHKQLWGLGYFPGSCSAYK